MAFSIFDIEVTAPFPAMALPHDHTGMAILLRHKGRPIDFWMKTAPENHAFSPSDLAREISDKIRDKLVAEKLREEIQVALPKPPLPTLTVAICTRDRPERLARCLNALRTIHDRPLGRSSLLEILVIDNNPSDERTRKLAAAASGVRYVREPLPGLDFARNRALREAKGEWIAYLDDDVTVDSQWLEGLWEAWGENPDAGAITGLVLPYELDTPAQILFEQAGGFRAGFEKRRFGPILPGSRDYPCNPGRFGTGANMAFSREVLLKIDGFDEALDTGAPLPGAGDLDIFYRVVRSGSPLVYEPRCLVFHQHRRCLKELQHQYWTWGLCYMTFLSKTYHSDCSQRSKVRRLIIRWFLTYLRRWQKCALSRNQPFPPNMVLAELMGGVQGIFGEYSRSRNRIKIIRENHS
ncbi:MAG: glycosyltransferase [Opitutales bacterium]